MNKYKSTSSNPKSKSPFSKTTIVLIAVLAIALASLLRSPTSKQLLSLFKHTPITKAMSITTSTQTTTTTPSQPSPLKIVKRPWNDRGHADHSWLYTFHTFSFASYHSPSHQSFGPLRVINEDRVARGTGFGTHSHREFLIWSYLVSGQLEHKDSMGNLETLTRGQVQFTSAGTGIRHSEYNRNESQDVHFLQIWATPNVAGLKPSYATREFGDELKRDRFVRIMESVERPGNRLDAATDPEPIAMHADVSMAASILSPGKTVEYRLVADGRRNVYLHVVMSGREQPLTGGARITVGNVELGEGDGAYVTGATNPEAIVVESTGGKPAEFLLFDMGE